MSEERPEIFTVRACRCRRCGGILVSNDGVENGIGPVCLAKEKEDRERRKPDPNQMKLWEDEYGEHSEG